MTAYNRDVITLIFRRIESCSSLDSLWHTQSFFTGFMTAQPEGIEQGLTIDKFFELRNKREAELKGEVK